MNSKRVLLTTEQAAARLNISVRRMQDYLAKNPLLAEMVGREYKIWSNDVEHLAELFRPRGRPRLAVSEGELELKSATFADAVEEAQTEEQMEEVLQEYLEWLERHRHIVQGLRPEVTPREVAFRHIEKSSRTLPTQQRAAWGHVLQRAANHARKQRLADHLHDIYHLNVAVRPKNDTDWCVELYALNDTEQKHRLTIIYEASIVTETCGACGKPFSFDDMEMVNMTHTVALPPLCGSCARSWNALADNRSSMVTTQLFEQFKRKQQQVELTQTIS